MNLLKRSGLKPEPAETGDTTKIASFNIQVFGKTKANKIDVMQIIDAQGSLIDIAFII